MMRMIQVWFLIVLFGVTLGITIASRQKPAEPEPAPAKPAKPAAFDPGPLLWAMAAVESRSPGQDTDVRGAAGEIGPLQITYHYWIDARMPDGEYEDCREWHYACRVTVRYWRRWCPEALRDGDMETLARVHNGGPRGAEKAATAATAAYWQRVQGELR